MSDEPEAADKPRWPKLRVIKKDGNGRAGVQARRAGDSLRKHELQERTQRQLDTALDELEAYKKALAQLRGYLKGIIILRGEQEVPVALLYARCTDSVITIEARGDVMIVGAKDALPEAPEAPDKPLLVSLQPGQNVRAGKLVQEHGEYYAHVVDKLPDF